MGDSLALIFAKKMMKSFERPLRNRLGNQTVGSENKTLDTMRMCNDCSDALLSEGKEASTNHLKSCFQPNAMVLLTQSIKTCRKLCGSVPIEEKKVIGI